MQAAFGLEKLTFRLPFNYVHLATTKLAFFGPSKFVGLEE
jgi:hypothetical protein